METKKEKKGNTPQHKESPARDKNQQGSQQKKKSAFDEGLADNNHRGDTEDNADQKQDPEINMPVQEDPEYAEWIINRSLSILYWVLNIEY